MENKQAYSDHPVISIHIKHPTTQYVSLQIIYAMHNKARILSAYVNSYLKHSSIWCRFINNYTKKYILSVIIGIVYSVH
jgi:hypothetical protein